MRYPALLRLLTAVLILSVSACSSPATPSSKAVANLENSSELAFSFNPTFEEFNPKNFDHSTNIDNQWFPLKPGTQRVYEGNTVENGETVPHRVVFTVTDLTKVISGVRTVVVWDRDYSSDQLVEAELAFFAQDNNGTVWHLGQYPEEYDGEKIVGAPAWIHGILEANAGITMPADPKPGMRDYSEGYGPAVDWTDRGLVQQVGQKVCITAKCYENSLIIAETSASEQGAYQLKYYAPGVGNIKTGWSGNDTTQETLELTEFNELNPQALADARREALKLEASAYQVSKDVYAQTSPAE